MNKKFLLMLIILMGLGIQSMAQGDLLITPKRVVFEGNKQREELNLVNIGKDTTTYSISFIQKIMKEDGSFVNIENPDPGQMFADTYLRIFPRTVTLAPGEPQVIMLQCRRNPDMLPGEYRSHLFFRSEKDYNPLGTKNSDQDSMKLSVQLIPIYGMSIPIIIRSGAINVSTTLIDLKLENRQDSIQDLNFSITRTGNISVYGDIKLHFIPANGKPFEIDGKRGVGIYTNINKRNIGIKLNSKQSKILKNGKLKVQYISNEESKKPVVYAEGELDI